MIASGGDLKQNVVLPEVSPVCGGPWMRMIIWFLKEISPDREILPGDTVLVYYIIDKINDAHSFPSRYRTK